MKTPKSDIQIHQKELARRRALGVFKLYRMNPGTGLEFWNNSAQYWDASAFKSREEITQKHKLVSFADTADEYQWELDSPR